jgi:general secretion pathway protein B
MSYILDALRKAERERKLGRVPGIDLNRVATNTGQPRSRWPVWVAAGLMLNALVLGAWYLYQTDTLERRPDPVEDAAPEAASANPEPPIQNPPDTEIAAVATPAEPAAPVVSSPPKVESDAAQAIPTKPSAAKPPPAPAPKPAAKAVTRRPPKPAPLLADMPPAYRMEVPQLDLSVHVYSDTPRKRFVFINGKQYREGQRMSEGPKVEQIQLQGVVLQYEGERFLLPGKW